MSYVKCNVSSVKGKLLCVMSHVSWAIFQESCVMSYVSCVICQVLFVMCQVSNVVCHVSSEKYQVCIK